jgi:glycosyltransferase involved in cell wall biosynthesis
VASSFVGVVLLMVPSVFEQQGKSTPDVVVGDDAAPTLGHETERGTEAVRLERLLTWAARTFSYGGSKRTRREKDCARARRCRQHELTMDPVVDALLVSPPTSVWGAQIYLLNQLDRLRERGVNLSLGTTGDSPFAEEWRRRELPIVDLGLHHHPGLRVDGSSKRPSVASLAKMSAAVGDNARRLTSVARRYDMLYSFSLPTHLETALAGRMSRTPVALDLVDLVRPGVGQRILRTAARLATLTVANSTATASLLGSAGPVRIIHPGIDLDRFHPGAPPPSLRAELAGDAECPLVGIVGRIDEGKGIHVLVDAMARLDGAFSTARLVVVGDKGTDTTDYADRLRRRAVDVLGDRVRFVGRRDDIPEIMRTLDVLVVAAVAEPFGLTALEAQASRTPVIGTDAGGLPEFVEDEVSGILVPPLDAERLAHAIERVLGDRTLRDRIVDEAERRANPARGLEAQYDDLARMYRDVATRSVRRG